MSGSQDIYYDCESRSTLDLKKVGVHKYARCPETDLHCATWASPKEGKIKIWLRGQPQPAELIEAVQRGDRFFMHNAEFDWTMWNEVAVKRYGWIPLPLSQIRCTASMAVAMGLPRALDNAARAAGVQVHKDPEGYKIMLKLCRPERYDDDLQPVWHTDPKLYQRLYSYAGQDIRVMYGLRRRVLDLRLEEQQLYELTLKVNERGVRFDLPPVQRALPMVASATKDLNTHVKKLTEGEVETTGQRNKMITFCADHMVGVPNLRRKTLELLLATQGEALPAIVTQVIQTRLEGAKTSTAKLKAILARVCHDGRLRGSLLYYGAGTGRFSSIGVQLQNLPRPTMDYVDCCYAVEMIRNRDRDDLEFWYGSTLQVVSDCLRSFIIPDPGNGFAVIDLAKIEAIINAWCAGQVDLLEAFRQGRDTYAEMAAKVYRRPINRKVDKIEGHVGKALILGAGYGLGGLGFWTQCVLNGILIDQATALEAIQTYRAENDDIVQHWYAQENAAMDAVRRPGQRVPCGRVEWVMRGGVLFCRLPSGRALSYPYACLKDKPDRHGTLRPRLHYRCILPGTNAWGEIDTYGAALVENIVQAIARDILVHIMMLSEDEGVPNILSVHDEIVAESRTPDSALSILKDIAQHVPYWAPGLPVSVDAGTMDRYGKLG